MGRGACLAVSSRPLGQRQRRPDGRTCSCCSGERQFDGGWRIVVDCERQHSRPECSSHRGTGELCRGGAWCEILWAQGCYIWRMLVWTVRYLWGILCGLCERLYRRLCVYYCCGRLPVTSGLLRYVTSLLRAINLSPVASAVRMLHRAPRLLYSLPAHWDSAVRATSVAPLAISRVNSDNLSGNAPSLRLGHVTAA